MVPGRSASSTDAASQSVIIAVTESATISEGAQAAPRIAPNVAEVVPPPVPSEPTVPPISSPRIDEAATSPAVRYVARRERNRRNQLVLAVVLLMSVIVLAIILILVLQRGFGTSTAYVVSSLRIVTCERSSKPPAEPGADGVRRSNDLLRG